MGSIKVLLKRASALNGGIPCKIEHPTDKGRPALCGGINYHARIRFSNGITWLARLPRLNQATPPNDFMNYLLKSEEYDLGLCNDPSNKVGVAYILMEELPGTPFYGFGPSGNPATIEELRKVWAGIANILIELEMYPFARIGSLVLDENNRVCVGPTASDRTGTLSFLGPFTKANDYYLEWCDAHLSLIADQFTSYPVKAYLQELDDGPFYLKHTDDKGDHILVDDDFNVTGIIDWTFARVVPKYEAFGPSLVTANMSDIYDGISRLSDSDVALASVHREKGSGLAEFAGIREKMRRLVLALGMGIEISWEEAVKLFEGIAKAFGEEEGLNWQDWERLALDAHSGDERLARLVAQSGSGLE
ncbi:hypothetical protein K440DRAFT_653617 [Wilcoxina mikolae CBS 423.85]|nr:hypothetical protein K440DRAFT_653617 [Wilcoxina mikolae CBS 423.85]